MRRNCIGVVRRGCSSRTKGHFSVRENLPTYEENSTCIVTCRVPSRVPRYRSTPVVYEAYGGTQLLSRATWMNPQQGFVLRGGYVCSIDGAEKSCRPRRRKRGLRKGKRRSRGRHPRRSVPDRQPSPKVPSSRKVNHSGRKFLWAVMASNRLRKVCEKLAHFPSRKRPPYRRPSPQVAAARLACKLHCMAVWTRLHNRATAIGLPPIVAFHDSFWKYMRMETSWGHEEAVEDFFELIAGLPGDPELDEFERGPRAYDARGAPTVNRRGRGAAPGRGRGRPLRRR